MSWHTVYASLSPDKNSELLVQEKACFADCALRIIVRVDRRIEQITTRQDCAVFFAHAEWSGNVVSAFIDGTVCGQIRVAYDVLSNRQADFTSAEVGLRQGIIRAYGVTPDELRENGGDVLKWATYPGACCSRAVDEFRKRQQQH